MARSGEWVATAKCFGAAVSGQGRGVKPASSFSWALGCSPRNEAGQAVLATVYPFSLNLFLPLQLLFVIQRQTPLQLSPLLQL